MKNVSFHIEVAKSFRGFGYSVMCTAVNSAIHVLIVVAIILSLGYWKFALGCICAALIIARLDWPRRRKLVENLQHRQAQTMAARLTLR